jgi:hypothetical protein
VKRDMGIYDFNLYLNALKAFFSKRKKLMDGYIDEI